MMSFSAAALGLAMMATAQQQPPNPYPDCVNGPLASSKICDLTASPSERAAALVEMMEPSEKLDNIIRFVYMYHKPKYFKTLLILIDLVIL